MTEADTPTGRVEVALVATGADGATYRLGPSTRMLLTQGDYAQVVPLDGNE
jgi:hypothetical protein